MLEDHKCNLPRQDEDVLKDYITTGLFISFRRTFRSLCLVSHNHPFTKRMFKSTATWRNERIRHVIHYYYLIHPFSMLNLYWEFFMFFVFSAQFIMAPMLALFSVKDKMDPRVYLIMFLIDCLQLADIIKLFFTGYLNKIGNKVILKPAKIAQHYFWSFLLFDVASCMHSYMYPIRWYAIKHNITILNPKFIMATRIFHRMRVIRIPRWLGILELYRQYMNYSCYIFRGIQAVLIFLVLSLCCFSLKFFVETNVFFNNVTYDTAYETYAIYYEATAGILVVGYSSEEQLLELGQYVMGILFLGFGFALQMFLYAQILQVWAKYVNAEDKHHYLHKQFHEYMKYTALPIELRGQISTYFDFKFHKHFFKESDINTMVSSLLKQEILLHVTKVHVERVDFFRHIPENILLEVVTQMKTEIYLPDDTIISAGSMASCMFFICSGTVAVYTPSGREICHLEDGAHFGEIALIFNETRVATVVAVQPTEVFILKRMDFLRTIEPYPEIKEELVAQATQRLHNTALEL